MSWCYHQEFGFVRGKGCFCNLHPWGQLCLLPGALPFAEPRNFLILIIVPVSRWWTVQCTRGLGFLNLNPFFPFSIHLPLHPKHLWKKYLMVQSDHFLINFQAYVLLTAKDHWVQQTRAMFRKSHQETVGSLCTQDYSECQLSTLQSVLCIFFSELFTFSYLNIFHTQYFNHFILVPQCLLHLLHPPMHLTLHLLSVLSPTKITRQNKTKKPQRRKNE